MNDEEHHDDCECHQCKRDAAKILCGIHNNGDQSDVPRWLAVMQTFPDAHENAMAIRREMRRMRHENPRTRP